MKSNSQNKCDRAKIIAKKILEQKLTNDIDIAQRNLAEQFMVLNKDRALVDYEVFSDCKGMVLEVLCLLTKPAISGQLQSDYYKNNCGRILHNLYQFFERLEEDNEVQCLLTYNNVNFFAGNMEHDELEEIEQQLELQN